MVLQADKMAPILKSLQPDMSPAPSSRPAVLQDAQQRWPLLRAIAPVKPPVPDLLTEDDRQNWHSPERAAPASEARAGLTVPGLNEKLALGIGKIAAKKTSPRQTSGAAKTQKSRQPQATPSAPAADDLSCGTTGTTHLEPTVAVLPVDNPAPLPVGQAPSVGVSVSTPSAERVPDVSHTPSVLLAESIVPAPSVVKNRVSTSQSTPLPPDHSTPPTMAVQPSVPMNPSSLKNSIDATVYHAQPSQRPTSEPEPAPAPASASSEQKVRSSEPLRSLFRRLENPDSSSAKPAGKKPSFLGRLGKR